MISKMTTEAVKAICSWSYPLPYDVYNYVSFDEAIENKSPLLDVENADNYLCFWDDEILIAYISIYKKGDCVFIGIGLAPDYCSKGLGKYYLKQGIATAKIRYPNDRIWIQVRSWNIRAIRCYESCGFKEQYRKIIKDRFGNDTEFVHMRLESEKYKND